MWLRRGRETISSLDLFGPGFTLLVPECAGEWDGVPLPAEVQVHRIPDGPWRTAYDVSAHGAVLVRPDGHVACRWRDAVADPAGTIARALDEILGRR